MVSSRNWPWLYDGVTTVMRGQDEPSGIVPATAGLPSVHGQPVLLAAGSSILVRSGNDVETILVSLLNRSI